MSRKYKFHNRHGAYFVTFAVVGWVDVFTRKEYCTILIDSLKHCQSAKGLELFAWCIMTNHVHFICKAGMQFSLSEILRDFKKFTSKALLKAIKDNPKESRKEWMLLLFSTEKGNRFWRGDNKPIEVYSTKIINQKLNYLHQNPVKAGWVRNAEDYVYSSAIDYAGRQGLLDVILVKV